MNPESQDGALLDLLVEWDWLSVEETEQVETRLAQLRVKRPNLQLSTLLIHDEYLCEEDVLTALEEVKTRLTPQAPKSRSSRSSRRRSVGVSRVRRSRYPVRRQSSPAPFIAGIVVVLLGALVVGYLYKQDQAANKPQSSPETAKSSAVVDSNSGPAPSVPAALPAQSDHQPAPASEMRLRKRLAKALGLGDPRDQVEALTDLRYECRGELEAEVEREIERALRSLDQIAQLALDQAEPELASATEGHDYGEALRLLDDLWSRFGREALDGAIDSRRDAMLRTAKDYCQKILQRGVVAYEASRYDEAKGCFEKVVSIGLESHIRTAKTWLKRTKGRTGGDAAIVSSSMRDKPNKAKEKGDDATDPKKGSGEVARAGGAKTGVDRLGKIQGKLSSLCPSGNAKLSEQGRFTVSYNFEQKKLSDGADWGPSLADGRQDIRAAVRWTLTQEEVVTDGMTGVRISDRGIWRHGVKLKPPLRVQVEYFPINQYGPRNTVAVCWLDEKGNGLATNFGQQLGFTQKGRPTRMKGPTRSVGVLRTMTMDLIVAGSDYHGLSGSTPTPSKSVPEKMGSGFIAVAWANEIAGTIQKIHISGMLDLDWAESELK